MKASRSKKSTEVNARVVVGTLQIMHEAVGAEIAAFEAERAENLRKTEMLRAAELAAPRAGAFYYRMARLIRAGLCPEITGAWLTTPNRLRKTAKALEIEERKVDRPALRVVKCFLEARSLIGEEQLKIKDIEDRHRKRYPKLRVPDRRSISRVLRERKLYNFKRGRPPKNNSNNLA